MTFSEHGPFGEEWSVSYVEEKLKDLRSTPARGVAPPDDYEKAAAVLAHFDPSGLVAVSGPTTASKEQVLTNSTVIFDEKGEPRSMLRAERRRAALGELGAQGIRSALNANARPHTPLQKMLDAYLLGQAPSLDSQSPEQLTATLQVIEWLGGLVPGVPDAAEVERRVARENLLRPFKELAGTAFVGRRRELDQLREYVAYLAAQSFGDIVRRGVAGALSAFGVEDQSLIVIHGPGGMGKSALLARFILDHSVSGDAPLPFVYLDFDRASLVAEHPVTLLCEAATQLASEFPQLAPAWEKLRPSWLSALQATVVPDSFFYDFNSLLVEGSVADRPLLIVFDTFEEVQYRSRDFVTSTFAFVQALQAVASQVRAVFVGRAPVTLRQVSIRNIPLGPLEAADAARFLSDRGISDSKLAALVAEQVGGNPLSLRLALEVVQKEGEQEGGLGWLQTRNRLFVRLQDNQIQGQLYRRILQHVHDPDVAKLAHPGLVLRRLTADLILEALAKPCGVDVPNAGTANRLFQEMQREVSLVTVAEDGSLHHLPEVRRVMLSLLRRDEPVKVREIQEAAVAYYARRPETDFAARAEMLYHMLLLGRPRADLDSAWSPELAPFLGDAGEELPPSSATWLTTRLGRSLDAPLIVNADLEDWERYALKRTRDVLNLGQPELALEILREREDRVHASPLYLPQAEAQIMTRDLAGAQNAIATGLREAGDPTMLLKLTVAGAWADRLSAQAPPPDSAAELRRINQRFANDPRTLRFGLFRLEQADLTGTGPKALSSVLSELARDITDSAFGSYPQIARDLAARLGVHDQELLLRVARMSGAAALSTAAGTAFLKTLHTWGAESGTFARFRVDMSPSDPFALMLNLELLRSRVLIPDNVWIALAGIFEAQVRSRSDQQLYLEIETEQPGSANDPRTAALR